MADPLSLLRLYNIDKKEIVEKAGQIVFGEFAWPKDVKTNYIIYDTNKDGSSKEYYTLDCVLYLLRNVHLTHPLYVRQAANQEVPVVTRADRKDLLAYLNGEIAASTSIDKSAPLVLPRELKRATEEPTEDVHKKPRLEEEQVLQDKKRLADRLENRGDVAVPAQTVRQIGSLSLDEIQRIRTKMLIKKQKTIKGMEDVGNEVTEKGMFIAAEGKVTKDIISRERPQRNRTTILQSQNRDFAANVFPLLQSVKAKEEGKGHHEVEQTPVRSALPKTPTTPAHGYNRYDQEKYNITRGIDQFDIDTKGTYRGSHGLTLPAVADNASSAAAITAKKLEQQQKLQQQQQQGRSVLQGGRPGPQKGRTSRTPIIVIPGVMTSLITMYNVKDLLQDFKFIPSDVKRGEGIKRETEILIQRKKESGTTVPYRVVDSTGKFETEDWERVVAVFVQGPAWQFKGWTPWHGNPVEIFDKVKAFHLKYDESALDSNIAGWAVEVLQLSKTKRHLDRPLMLKFWTDLDKYCIKWKPHLRT